MDEILERKIKFLEGILKNYYELTEKSGRKDGRRERMIDKMLEDLHELYKQRKK